MRQETREAVLALAEERLRMIADLPQHPAGLAWCAWHTDLCDRVVRMLCDDIGQPGIAVIATGGYGRRELSPFSDIDITVLPVDEASPNLDEAIRTLFQDLHWAFCTAMRLNVGYAYRLLADAPGLDAKTRTGLMDMRLLWGSHEMFRQLDEALREAFAAGEFILAKIREREAMFARHHDTPFVVEPHLKEGAGGVRCFHCANWIREAIGEQAARPTPEYDRLIRVRNLLHAVADKYTDVLTRGRQSEIADRIGWDPYDLGSAVAKAGMAVHQEFCRAKERIFESRFPLSPGVLAVMGEVRVIGNADPGEAAVGIAVATQLGMRVSDIPVHLASSKVQGPAAMFAVSTGEATIRNLDRCGLLGQLLPELEACRTLMPRDSVHTFTVFEHSLRVVRFLDSIEPGTFLGDVRASLRDLEPLYLAALLHDVGKIDESRPHSEVGGEKARAVCNRWGLDESIASDIVWLVLKHLEMSKFIRIRDTQDPRTIREFAKLVRNPDRLGMLTLLTWADVCAVADGAWTAAQDTFLRDLYHRTMAALQGDAPTVPDVAQTRQRLLRQLKGKESEDEVRRFVESLPVAYMTSTPLEVVPLHMQFVRKAGEGEPSIELFHRNDIGASDVTICALDRPGLLSELLGVFYAFDLSVMGIRAATTQSEPPVALDTFTLSFSGRPVPTATYNQVAKRALEVARGETTAERVLRDKGKDPNRKQQFFSHVYHEGSPGMLEVRAPRGRGMPYRFSRLLAAQGWNIVSARVGQWAGNGAATFGLTGPGDTPLTKETVDRVLGSL